METISEGNNNQENSDKNRLSALEDSSLLDIATSPEYSTQDSLDAEAAIKERQETGSFDESGEQSISTEDDLLRHNYGVIDGRIIAPPEGYRNSETEEQRQQDIGRTALDEYDEDIYNPTPVHEARKPHRELHPYRDDRGNPNLQHKAEMREAERSKFNKRAVKEETEKFREFKKYAPEHWKYRGKKFETNHYYLPTKKDRLTDREAQKEGEERRPELIQLDGEMVSPEKRMKSALEYAKWRLNKKDAVKQMYAEGALDEISEGDFSLNPNFIYSGLKSLHGREINRRAGSSSEAVWDSIRYDGMLPRIETPEQLADLEREALESAIELGVIENRNGALGEREFKTALPIEKLGEMEVSGVLARYGLVLGRTEDEAEEGNEEFEERSQELYEKYESGFVNIVDALKGDPKSEKGFRELKWYFETLLQKADEDTIADRVINVYEAGENSAFVAKFNQFMQWREQIENKAFTENEPSDGDSIDERDQEIINATMEGVDLTGLPEEEIFPAVDYGHDRTPRNGRAWKHPVDYGRRKLASFNDHLSQIEAIPGFQKQDPYKVVSKPVYLRKIYKNVKDKYGREQKVVDRVIATPAHYDSEQKAYVSDLTGRKIKQTNIRRYISAYFSIGDTNVTIKEGITDMSSSLYVILSDTPLGSNSPIFHSTMQNAVSEIQKRGGVIFKKNHCSYTKDGQKGYYGFEKMWEETIKKVLNNIKKQGEAV